MKKLGVTWSGVLLIFALGAGCCSVKPAHAPTTAAAASTPADQSPDEDKTKDKDSPPHDYPMKWFVDEWLLGKSAPPDFPEPGNQGSEAWAVLEAPITAVEYLLGKK